MGDDHDFCSVRDKIALEQGQAGRPQGTATSTRCVGHPHASAASRKSADLALFNLGIDSKVRGCDLVGLRAYTDFEDELCETTKVHLKQVTAGLNMIKFKEKARQFLNAHEAHLSLQRLRRNQALTTADLAELERMLFEAGGTKALIDEAKEKSHGLGIFIRSLVGLDREAAMQVFSEFLTETTATRDQNRVHRAGRAGTDRERADGGGPVVLVAVHGHQCAGTAGFFSGDEGIDVRKIS